MNKRELKKIYTQVAQKCGVSVAEVRREIELALQIAKNNSALNVQAKWANIPHKKTHPLQKR